MRIDAMGFQRFLGGMMDGKASNAQEAGQLQGLRQLGEQTGAVTDAAARRRRALSSRRLWTEKDGFTLSGARKAGTS